MLRRPNHIKATGSDLDGSGPDTRNAISFSRGQSIDNAAPGYSSGDAIADMERITQDALPADFSYALTG